MPRLVRSFPAARAELDRGVQTRRLLILLVAAGVAGEVAIALVLRYLEAPQLRGRMLGAAAVLGGIIGAAPLIKRNLARPRTIRRPRRAC